MNPLLAKVNRSLRLQSPAGVAERCGAYLRNGFLHISLESGGCRYRDAGYCSMCDYGSGRPLDAAELAHSMEAMWSGIREPVREVLLGSCGSIFDTREVSAGALDVALRFLAAHPVPTVIFETHYTTVTAELLARVKHALSAHTDHIVIEMGLESADPEVLQNAIHKRMDLSALCDTIALIHSFGMSAILNVFLGAPFLPPALQLADAENAVAWAFEHGADGVVVFPANIKHGTLLGYLYVKGRYLRPSAWLLAELLRRIPTDRLGRVEVSWYGDRQSFGMAKDAIPPYACEVCGDALLQFFTDYNALRGNPEARREGIETLLRQSGHCACHRAMEASIEQEGGSVTACISRELALLRQEFAMEGEGE